MPICGCSVYESRVGPQLIVIYYTTDSANGITGTGNTFQNVTEGTSGGGYTGHTLAGTPSPLSIGNNACFSYVGSSLNTGGGTSAGNGFNPVYENPQITCRSVNIARGSPVFRAP
jgi:hypothetical protein